MPPSYNIDSYTSLSYTTEVLIPPTPGTAGSGRTLDKPRTMDKG